MTLNQPNWHHALQPQSIAVIGASANKTKRGYQIVEGLVGSRQQNRFQGAIYPVNPSLKALCGLHCFSEVAAIPESVDLAVICTPAKTVPHIIEQCGQQGIPLAVVLAAGFEESGEDGLALTHEIREFSERYGVRVLGPNISGLFLQSGQVDLVGFPSIREGHTAMLSQSGNIALGLICQSNQRRQYGFSHYFGIGNQLDLNFGDLLQWLMHDNNTHSAVAYIEGLKDAKHFLRAAKLFTAHKPLVAYKAGRTKASQQAAKSHTGALAGNYRVSCDLLKQNGVTLVDDVDDLLPVSQTLTSSRIAPSGRFLVLTDGGGHGAIAADLAEEHGVELANLPSQKAIDLEQRFPGIVVGNPIDVAGIADDNPTRFADLIGELINCEEVDGIIWVGLFGGYHIRFNSTLFEQEMETVRLVHDQVSRQRKPVLLQSLYTARDSTVLETWCNLRLNLFQSIESVMKASKALVDRSRYLKHLIPSDYDNITLIPSATAGDTGLMAEFDARRRLVAAGVAVNEGHSVLTRDQLQAQATLFESGQKWAMKINSPDVLHKSDVGGVALNIASVQEAESAFDSIVGSVAQHLPKARLYGVVLIPMSPKGVEFVIGCKRDEQFGAMIMFGIGGVFVELYEDVQFRELPLTNKVAKDMIQSLRLKKLLNGFRDLPALDTDAMVNFMQQVGQFFYENPDIAALDLNPVIAHQTGVSAVDVRLEITQGNAYDITKVS